MSWHWLVMPAVGALIGYATNALAVRMIFRPRRPISILGINWQGLLPKRRSELAHKVAEIVERELLSTTDLRAVLTSREMMGRFQSQLEKRLDEFIEGMLSKVPPMLRALVPAELSRSMRQSVLDDLMAELPTIIEEIADEVESRLDLKQIVIDKMERFDLARLEQLVLDIARSELQHIELLGGVLGLLVGLAQAGIVTLLPMAP